MFEDPKIHVDEHVSDDVTHIAALSREGLDYLSLDLRFDTRTGPARALFLLARVGVEVIVRARKSKPVQVLAKEARDA